MNSHGDQQWDENRSGAGVMGVLASIFLVHWPLSNAAAEPWEVKAQASLKSQPKLGSEKKWVKPWTLLRMTEEKDTCLRKDDSEARGARSWGTGAEPRVNEDSLLVYIPCCM